MMEAADTGEVEEALDGDEEEAPELPMGKGDAMVEVRL